MKGAIPTYEDHLHNSKGQGREVKLKYELIQPHGTV